MLHVFASVCNRFGESVILAQTMLWKLILYDYNMEKNRPRNCVGYCVCIYMKL